MISNISQMYLKWTSNVPHQISKWIRTLDVGWLHGFILILSSTLSCFCKEIWTFGVGWLQTSANFLETVFGQFVRHFTIVTSLPPPSIMSEGGRFGGVRGGVRGDRSLTCFYFSSPPLSKCKNFRLRLLTLGGSTLAISMTPAVKFRGGKIAIYIFGTPPCLQLA